VYGEPGLHPTVYLRLLLSHGAAEPGETVSLRVEGTDAAAMIRGKVLVFDREQDGAWQYVGCNVAASQWHPSGEAGMFAVTLEGYGGTQPMSFHVPPVPPGDYRIRLDLTRSGDGPVRERTATLFGFLRVLALQSSPT
jgi:hypothetical protein